MRKLAFSGALLASTGAWASTDPTSFITNLENQLQSVARQAAAQSGFRHIFEEDFDIPGISRFVLGRFAKTPISDFKIIGSRSDGGGTTVYS